MLSFVFMSKEATFNLLNLICMIFKLGLIITTLFISLPRLLITLGLMVEEEGFAYKEDLIEPSAIMNNSSPLVIWLIDLPLPNLDHTTSPFFLNLKMILFYLLPD